ncbi:ProQ/FINO family protein, partial [Escherichia coli]
SSGAGRTSDGNGSHASTLKSPSYTKSVSWQHYPPRYGLDGKVHGTVTEEEAQHAQAKLEKHTQRYNARMKETEDARRNQPSTD